MKRKDKLARRSARAALERLGKPERRSVTLTSAYLPGTGQVVLDVTRGAFGGSNGVLYKLDETVLAGAIEHTRELAVVINNVGLLVLSQLIGFTLGDSLEGLPAAIAKWAHIDVAELKRLAAEEAEDEARTSGGDESPDGGVRSEGRGNEGGGGSSDGAGGVEAGEQVAADELST